MKFLKRKRWVLIAVITILVLVIGFGVYAITGIKIGNGFSQSAEQAEGLPYDQCICWSGLGASGHCIASEACE